MTDDDRQPTMEELRASMPMKGPKPTGLYAAQAGTGPAGRTCQTCDHLIYMRSPSKHPKCGLTNYTHGDATTIKTRTPACKHYKNEPDL